MAQHLGIHAHKCEVCALHGVETIWIHGDCQAGSEVAHACPRCGDKNWRATPVLVGKLPSEQKISPLPKDAERALRNVQAGYTMRGVDILLVIVALSFMVALSAYLLLKDGPKK
jgi:hypothetical protein